MLRSSDTVAGVIAVRVHRMGPDGDAASALVTGDVTDAAKPWRCGDAAVGDTAVGDTTPRPFRRPGEYVGFGVTPCTVGDCAGAPPTTSSDADGGRSSG
jgi:hypothetical protein